MKPKVFIILVNFKSYAITEDCLNSIARLTYDNFKVIVVDNESDEELFNKIKTNHQSIIFINNNENTGFAEGCNIGARLAIKSGAEAIWLLNNDTIVDQESLSPLVDALKDRSVGAAGSLTFYYDQPNIVWFLAARITWPSLLRFSCPTGIGKPYVMGTGEKIETDYLHGCSMLISKEAWLSVGELDANYFAYGEEIDWCIRAKRKGFRLITVANSKIWHRVSLSSGGEGSPLSSYYINRNIIRILASYYGKGVAFYLYQLYLFIKATLMMASLKRSRRQRGRAAQKGLIDYILGKTGKAEILF